MQTKYTVVRGDSASPILLRLRDRHHRPADLAGRTLKYRVENDDGTEVVAETDSGIVVERERPFTFTQVGSLQSAKNYITDPGHAVEYGDELVLSPHENLPEELSMHPAGHRFYPAAIAPNTFTVSARPNEQPPHIWGGAIPDLTYHIVGSAEVTLPAALVQNVGEYRLWVHSYNGVTRDTFPDADGYIIEVLDMGN